MAHKQAQPDWQQAAAAVGPTQPTQRTPATMSPLQARHAAAALGQVQQGAAGYIGNSTRSGLLGMVR